MSHVEGAGAARPRPARRSTSLSIAPNSALLLSCSATKRHLARVPCACVCVCACVRAASDPLEQNETPDDPNAVQADVNAGIPFPPKILPITISFASYNR